MNVPLVGFDSGIFELTFRQMELKLALNVSQRRKICEQSSTSPLQKNQSAPLVPQSQRTPVYVSKTPVYVSGCRVGHAYFSLATGLSNLICFRLLIQHVGFDIFCSPGLKCKEY